MSFVQILLENLKKWHQLQVIMIGHPKLCHLPSNSQGSHQSRHPGRPWSERSGFPLPNHFLIFPAVPLHPPIGSPADITSKHLLHWNWWILVDWAPCLVINSGSLQWFVEWFGDSKFWECLKRLLYSIQGLLKRLSELQYALGHPWSTYYTPQPDVFEVPFFWGVKRRVASSLRLMLLLSWNCDEFWL
jgi:hypothetical protein